MKFQYRSALAALVVWSMSGACHAGSSFALTVLEGLGGQQGSAAAINAWGVVVGTSTLAGDGASHATLWSDGVASDLGTLGGTNSYARAINANGQVAGVSQTAGNAYSHAVGRYGNGGWVDLGVVDGVAGNSAAAGINVDGKVVGQGQSADYYQHAILWKASDELKDIGQGGPMFVSAAYAVNDAGSIVGFNDGSGGGPAITMLAALWTPGANGTYTESRLGSLGGVNSFASAISATGDVVGNSQKSGSTAYRATMWRAGTTTAIELGTLGGSVSFATGVNVSGWAVGTSQTAGDAGLRATLWKDGVTLDLNSLINPLTSDGWILTSASGINDEGWIVGQASRAGQTRAFVLSPVPEPASCAMLLAGLAAVATAGHRRRRVLARVDGGRLSAPGVSA